MSNTRTTAPMATEAAMREDFAAVSDLLGGGAPDDVHALYRSFRASQPVMEGDILARFGVPSQADYSNLGRKVYTLFKYHDVMAVLRDPESYSSSLLNEGLGQFLGGFLMTGMEGDRHRVIRNLLAPAFSPVAVARWKERLRPVVREAIDRLVPAGKADLVQDVLLPLPVRLIYAIMGYPPDERKMQEYAARAMKILVGPQRDPEKLRLSLEAAFKAARELYDDTLAVVRQRRAEGSAGDDLMGFLIRARYEDRTLSDEEITELMRQFLPAAAETTTRSFGSMLVALLQRPALLDRVRANRALVPKVIVEGMRWETASQFLARQCTREVEIRGVTIPAGTGLSLACGSANRDEEVFDNADEFDIDRPTKPNLGFGFGPHLCLGHQIARLEMETILDCLLDAMPNLRLDPTAAEPKIVGAQLRGPRALPVVWD